jgi:hypothetical protein
MDRPPNQKVFLLASGACRRNTLNVLFDGSRTKMREWRNLVDALDLGSSPARGRGSSPLSRTSRSPLEAIGSHDGDHAPHADEKAGLATRTIARAQFVRTSSVRFRVSRFAGSALLRK